MHLIGKHGVVRPASAAMSIALWASQRLWRIPVPDNSTPCAKLIAVREKLLDVGQLLAAPAVADALGETG